MAKAVEDYDYHIDMTRGTTKEYDEKERDEVIYCEFICSFVLTNILMENIKIGPELVARQIYKHISLN